MSAGPALVRSIGTRPCQAARRRLLASHIPPSSSALAIRSLAASCWLSTGCRHSLHSASAASPQCARAGRPSPTAAKHSCELAAQLPQTAGARPSRSLCPAQSILAAGGWQTLDGCRPARHILARPRRSSLRLPAAKSGGSPVAPSFEWLVSHVQKRSVSTLRRQARPAEGEARGSAEQLLLNVTPSGLPLVRQLEQT